MANNTARLCRIETLIRARGHVSFAMLLAELEVSPATLKRDLEFLRSRLGAPIEYDRDLNGYRFGAACAGGRHELPGLWFDEAELYSLLTAQQLLSSLDSDGLLSRHLQPLLDRIHQLLGSGESAAAETLMQRVKIVTALRRPVPSEMGERDVSPQRLVHYRNTWYLDAWCHRVQALRRFALDAMEAASLLDEATLDIPLTEVQAKMDAGYGIYAGGRRRWAVLEFDARAALWASREEWHPEQKGRWLADGRYELRLPYVDDTELVMDILRQGEQVRVLAPAALVAAVRQRLVAAAALYCE